MPRKSTQAPPRAAKKPEIPPVPFPHANMGEDGVSWMPSVPAAKKPEIPPVPALSEGQEERVADMAAELDALRGAPEPSVSAPSDSTASLPEGSVVNFVDKYLTTERVLRAREELGCPPEFGPIVSEVHSSLIRDGMADYQALSQKQQYAVGVLAAKRIKAILEEAA